MTARALGPAVLIDGDTLAALRYAVAVAIREKRRNGSAPGPLLDQLDHAAAAALVASKRHDDTPIPPDEQPSDQWIDTDTAAARLGVSRRSAQRIAPQLGGRRVGRAWLIDPLALTEHLADREEPHGQPEPHPDPARRD